VKSLLSRHTADSLVCFGGHGERTAAQLAAYARAIAAALPVASDGPEARDRVVLACVDRYHFAAALAAIWLRGLVAELPVNGQPATVHALARGRRALALLHDRDEPLGIDVRVLESQPCTPSELAGEREHALAERSRLPLALALDDDAVAVIAYTSGTTGEPTPHEKTLLQLLREPEAQLVAFDLAARRVVAAVPPYHIYGLLFGVLVPLLGGGSMSRSSPLQPAELLRELARARADVLISVPPQLAALAAFEADHWPSLARVFSSAAPLPATTSQALRARGWRVTEILGSTETGGIAHRSASDAAWTPLPSVRIDVEHDASLSVDSPWLSPAAPRPLRTADRVALDEDGGFRHLGRSDAVVKVGGRRIDLGELETRLKQCTGVRDARVVAVESQGVRGLELLAVVEQDAPGARLEVATLRAELARHVDPVALPRRFRIVERMPRGETGKLARRDLLALFDVWSFPREQLPDGRVRFSIPRDSGYFRGHFEQQPILPGVVQLQRLALEETRRRFPELRVLSRLTRVKFKRLLAPGEVLDLTLQRKSEHTVAFTLETDGKPAASGVMQFDPVAPPSTPDAGEA
jgi:4-coumarate--CoA ligase (photoactive yellow protein activation family)